MKRFIRAVLRKLLSLIPEEAEQGVSHPLVELASPGAAVARHESSPPQVAATISVATPIAATTPLPDAGGLTASSEAPEATSGDEAPPLLPTINPILLRDAFRHYLIGNGLEVGALHNPLDLSGLSISKISYVDRFPESELIAFYPELEGQPLVHVDIVDDGEVLATIPNGSLDFIIGNHFLEHTRNPIGTIKHWLTKLAPGGILFLAIPDQRFTFDTHRPPTPLEHMVEDYRCSPEKRKKRDHQHFWEWAAYVNEMSGEAADARAAYLEGIDYSIHFHTFRLQSFLKLLRYMEDKLHIPFELKACADVSAGGNEFLVILSPKAPDTPEVIPAP